MIKRVRERLRQLWQEDRYRTDIKQFVEFGLGYFVVLVVGYLLLRKINLSLSEAEMGKFSYVQSLVLIVAPVLYLAAPSAYLRFHEEHCVSVNLRSFLMPLFYFACVILAGIVYWKTRSCFSLFYAAYPFFMEKTYFLRAQMEVRKLNALRTLELLVPLSLLYSLTSFGNADADYVLGFYGLGYVVSFFFVSKKQGTSEIEKRDVICYLWPLVFTSLLVVLVSNVAVIAAKHFWGYEAAGQMGVAVRALLFIRSLSALFLMFYPMIYFREMRKRNIGIIRIYRVTMIGIMVLFAGGLILFASLVYRILGASAYLGTVGVFRILVVAELVNFFVDVYCLYFAHEVKTWKGTVVKVANILLLLAGLPFLASHREPALMLLVTLIMGAAACSAALGLGWAVIGERHYLKEG